MATAIQDKVPIGPTAGPPLLSSDPRHHDGVRVVEDDYFGDQDDAQSFIQPAISPVAARLTSPKTPAAEKVAAMDRLPGGGLFDILDFKDEKSSGPPSPNLSRRSLLAVSGSASGPSALSRSGSPNKLVKPQDRIPSNSPQSVPVNLPTPWKAGPRELVFQEAISSTKSAMNSVFGSQTSNRQQRSSSLSENALRRLSKALSSISIPANFNMNISSLELSMSSQPREEPAPTPPVNVAQSQQKLTSHEPLGPPHVPAATFPKTAAEKESEKSFEQKTPAGLSRPASIASRRSHGLRRSTSDDSLLYHSLSRVSSFGDDERFTHIREQVNSRLKAIKDSFDGPTFKLPQLPNILPSPLFKSTSGESAELPRSNTFPNSGRQAKNPLPPLDAALESLTGDVVILGGYRGSILRSAQYPYRQLWVPVKVGLNIRKVNMEVGLDPEDEENMEKHIFASGMLQNIGPVDISKKLFKKMRECENARKGKLRVHDFGYDWRLSPHLLSRKLVQFLEKLPSNDSNTAPEHRGALVIAHSLGGLITRHAVNQRPELFSGVIFAGTPQRCINILGPVRNGDAVLLNEKVLTAQVHFSLRTTFAFLPEDGFCFIDKYTKEEYPIDFYNVDDWIKYRLCPCVGEPVLPPYLSRSNTVSSLLSLPDTLSGIPLRSRSNTASKDRTISPQLGSYSSYNTNTTTNNRRNASPPSHPPTSASTTSLTTPASQARNIAYLTRTLASIKQFRAELAHNPSHQGANRYPPLSVIYGKDIPTVYAARVASRDAIACADAYDDLVFRSGDGVVLARESMLPPGYELVRDGRVRVSRGHVTILGDLVAVGRALEAVVRGRRKGIGIQARERVGVGE